MALELYEHSEFTNIAWKLWSNTRYLGQSFTNGYTEDNEDFYLHEIQLKLDRDIGTTFTDIRVTINKVVERDNGQKYPVYPEIVISENVDYTVIPEKPSSPAWITFSFGNKIKLKKSVEYVIVLSIVGDNYLWWWSGIPGVDDYGGGSALTCNYADETNPDNWASGTTGDTDFKVYGIKAPVDDDTTRITPTNPSGDMVLTGQGRSYDKYIKEVFCIETELFKAVGKHVDLINKKKNKLVKDLKRCLTYEN